MKIQIPDLVLKIASLAVAFILWRQVTTDIRTLELLIPYEVKGIAKNRILISSFKDKVKVLIRGPSYLLRTVERSYPVFDVSVPISAQQDRMIAKFSEEDLALPSPVKVLSVEPKQIELLFDVRAWKAVPVEVPRVGQLDPDNSLVSIEVLPNVVKLEGPLSKLRDIHEVETYPLRMSELVSSSEQLLGLRVPELVDVDSPSVKVRFNVQPVVVTETFDKVPVQLLTRRARGKSSLDPAAVPTQSYTQVSNSPVSASGSNAVPVTTTPVITAWAPPNTGLSSTVIPKESGAGELDYSEMQIVPKNVRLRVSGPRRILKNISSSDLRVEVGPITSYGKHRLKVSSKIDPSLTVLSIEPEFVEVSILEKMVKK